MVLTDPVVLAAIPGGGAHLVGRRANSLPDVRRADGPDGGWRRITPTQGPASAYSAVVDARGLVVGDGNGQAWRLRTDGRFAALPGTPGPLTGGAAGVLLGLPSAPGTVQLSDDGGASWRAERRLNDRSLAGGAVGGLAEQVGVACCAGRTPRSRAGRSSAASTTGRAGR
jgi:hypothetical protein